jgi:hypothetical protein
MHIDDNGMRDAVQVECPTVGHTRVRPQLASVAIEVSSSPQRGRIHARLRRSCLLRSLLLITAAVFVRRRKVFLRRTASSLRRQAYCIARRHIAHHDVTTRCRISATPGDRRGVAREHSDNSRTTTQANGRQRAAPHLLVLPNALHELALVRGRSLVPVLEAEHLKASSDGVQRHALRAGHSLLRGAGPLRRRRLGSSGVASTSREARSQGA